MKRTVLFSLLFIALFACKNDDQSNASADTTDVNKIIDDTTKYTTIKWDASEVNFGSIKAGEKALVKFKFTNTGDKPLYITSVSAACGCTVADYTKGAVPAGASGEVTGEFNSTGYSGTVSKYITVIANTKPENMQRLIFAGDVKK
jgi:hypothetical protein